MKVFGIWIVATICILGLCCAFEETQESDGKSILRFLSKIGSRQLKKPPRKNIGECDISCQSDSNCVTGLLCAKQHQATLKQKGWRARSAYCSTNVTKRQYVCYNPNITKTGIQICTVPWPLGSCDVTTEKDCVGIPSNCCRQVLNTTSDGQQICAPQTCWQSGCQCMPELCSTDNTFSWTCFVNGFLPNCIPSKECAN